MIRITKRMKCHILLILHVTILITLCFHYMSAIFIFVTSTLNRFSVYKLFFSELRRASRQINEWQPTGHSYTEQLRLHEMSTMIAGWPEDFEDNIPTVPCLSADRHLLVLSVGASRIRYGTSLSFIMVYPTDVKTVLPENVVSNTLSSNEQSLWCIFDDGSVTPAYSYDSRYGNDRASLLDCSLSVFASDRLWKHNKTIRVYLASSTDLTRNTPILKAFVNVPQPVINLPNSSYELLTLCTSPLHNQAKYLTQWIEFHRLVGFRKFVVYNTTDTDNHLASVLSTYARKHSNLVDVVQWNFSKLALVDVLSTRYFQTEALHDCLIRYGDQAEWLGMLDLDEYVIPLHPYETVVDYLHKTFGRRILGSVNLWSHFYCTKVPNKYTSEENDTNHLTIERFTFRALHPHKSGREKYLYRPRFVQYLSIHHQIIGLSKEQPSDKHIKLAHYALMNRLRTVPGCDFNQSVKDTDVRDRFAHRVKNAIAALTTKI